MLKVRDPVQHSTETLQPCLVPQNWQRSKVHLLSFWRKAEHWYLSKKLPKPSSFKLEILLGDDVGWSSLTLNYRVFLKCISLISWSLLIKPGLAGAILKTLCKHERWLKPWKTWMLQEAKHNSDMQVMDGQSIPSLLPYFLPTTFLHVSLVHFSCLSVNVPLKRKFSAYRLRGWCKCLN